MYPVEKVVGFWAVYVLTSMIVCNGMKPELNRPIQNEPAKASVLGPTWGKEHDMLERPFAIKLCVAGLKRRFPSQFLNPTVLECNIAHFWKHLRLPPQSFFPSRKSKRALIKDLVLEEASSPTSVVPSAVHCMIFLYTLLNPGVAEMESASYRKIGLSTKSSHSFLQYRTDEHQPEVEKLEGRIKTHLRV